jgi:hypothetical protein
MLHSSFAVCLVAGQLFCIQTSMDAQGVGVPAGSPPMGWNSWDSFGTTVTEKQVANANWMVKNLKPFGWQYVVVESRSKGRLKLHPPS